MAIPIYFAMTAAEFASCPAIPKKAGWMACHFSPSGNGLSNLPSVLPADAMLILDDSFPPDGHDPVLVARQLHDAAKVLGCGSILLDFQRPKNEETTAFVSKIIQNPPCPVGISPAYAQPDFPVLLPPVPLDTPIEAYLTPWASHEIWLEAALGAARFRVDAQGCTETALSRPMDAPWQEKLLVCHYGMDISCDHIDFTLCRTMDDLILLLEKAEAMGVSQSVALWQELQELAT